ncbi:MAG: C45 family peptidase [Candidatus Gottesmanbacteria bacterium]
MIKTFPYLEVTGNNRDVGLAIGEMFRGKIQEVISDRKHYIRKYQERLSQTAAFVKETKKAFPHLVLEMEGMAEGADVPFVDLFFHNTPEIYDRTREWDREQAQTEDHCTIAVSFTERGPIVGHNEDWSIESLDELYVLKATINGTTYLGLNYATFLIGCSATLTSNGLVQCINELHQESHLGVGKSFVARAILDCKTLDEAVILMKETQRSSGYNHVLVKGKEMLDIETAGIDIDIERQVSSPYAHTNHFISKHMTPFEKDESSHHKNSYDRLARANELVRNDMTTADMMALLSDTKNIRYPICREDATIGSVILEPLQKQILVCYGPPDRGTFVPYKL